MTREQWQAYITSLEQMPRNTPYRAGPHGMPDSGGDGVAVNGVVFGGWGVADDMRNARLFAAALELRAALEALLKWGDEAEELLFPDTYKPWAEARALLARIDGEEQ